MVHEIVAISQLNREVTMKRIIYVGIDVHKSTFSACCYKAGTQSYFAEDTFEGSADKVLEYLSMVKDSMEGDIEFHCGYEAGCM